MTSPLRSVAPHLAAVLTAAPKPAAAAAPVEAAAHPASPLLRIAAVALRHSAASAPHPGSPTAATPPEVHPFFMPAPPPRETRPGVMPPDIAALAAQQRAAGIPVSGTDPNAAINDPFSGIQNPVTRALAAMSQGVGSAQGRLEAEQMQATMQQNLLKWLVPAMERAQQQKILDQLRVDNYKLAQLRYGAERQRLGVSQANASSAAATRRLNAGLALWKATGKAPKSLEEFNIPEGTAWTAAVSPTAARTAADKAATDRAVSEISTAPDAKAALNWYLQHAADWAAGGVDLRTVQAAFSSRFGSMDYYAANPTPGAKTTGPVTPGPVQPNP